MSATFFLIFQDTLNVVACIKSNRLTAFLELAARSKNDRKRTASVIPLRFLYLGTRDAQPHSHRIVVFIVGNATMHDSLP